MPIHFLIVCGCLLTVTAELRSYKRLYGLQSLNFYSLALYRKSLWTWSKRWSISDITKPTVQQSVVHGPAWFTNYLLLIRDKLNTETKSKVFRNVYNNLMCCWHPSAWFWFIQKSWFMTEEIKKKFLGPSHWNRIWCFVTGFCCTGNLVRYIRVVSDENI